VVKVSPGQFLDTAQEGAAPFRVRQRFAMLELKAALCAILGNFVLEAANKREDIVMITEIIISIYLLLATRFFLQNK
jgi:hypothetical protein